MKIAVVGGGAAGMMVVTAIVEFYPKVDVVILEKNSFLGHKVMISGGGRCNITTADSDIKSLMKKYPRGAAWLRFAMYNFGPKETFEWFSAHGIPLKIENNKVFPKSDKGTDVVGMFVKLFKKNNVKVLFGKNVKEIRKEKSVFHICFSNGDVIDADKVILTTGGNAYGKTGSSGDGYVFAESFGHTVTPLVPTLTSFISNENFVVDLAGVSFENVKLQLFGNKKYEFTGSFLFTHIGVSGPAVFALSSLAVEENCDKGRELKLFIDFVPLIDYEKLRREIENFGEKSRQSLFFTAISKFIPKSLTAVIFKKLKIDKLKKIAAVGKKDINRCVESLKNFKMNIVGRTAGTEIVTAGGVNLAEVDPKTMESKLCRGLYFAGEILDVDGFTGGYNLQAAWATGRLAGESAGKFLI